MPSKPSSKNLELVIQAIGILGGPDAAVASLGVTATQVNRWLKGTLRVGFRAAALIEKLTKGQISASALMPKPRSPESKAEAAEKRARNKALKEQYQRDCFKAMANNQPKPPIPSELKALQRWKSKPDGPPRHDEHKKPLRTPLNVRPQSRAGFLLGLTSEGYLPPADSFSIKSEPCWTFAKLASILRTPEERLLRLIMEEDPQFIRGASAGVSPVYSSGIVDIGQRARAIRPD